MKFLLKKGFFSIALIGLIITSCSKYAEGSNFTLLTKKARMVNEWTLESTQLVNYVYPETSSFVRKILFKKDNTYVRSETKVGEGASTISYSGTWEFSSDKTKLNLIEQGSNTTIEYIILELKSKELKLKETSFLLATPAILKFKGL